MDILIVGSGGREHALAWKIAQSPRAGKIYIAPGNGGTREIGENVPIQATDALELAKFASEKNIGLTIVGPEEALAVGIVDIFRSRGLRIFGPTKAAAQIETSKSFAKQMMRDAHIPTPAFIVAHTIDEAVGNIRRMKPPYVIKASGLASGKGVSVCNSIEEAQEMAQKIMVERIYGDAGNELVIEEFADGAEISIHTFTDGRNYVTFPPSQDHKHIGENDTGKNTGGMGVITPLPWVMPEAVVGIEQHVVKPILEALAMRDTPFTGLLYPGIVMQEEGPTVLEFNARFGDPEAQVYMRLLKSDLLDLIEGCIDGGLTPAGLKWNWGFAVTVVLASGGYPDEFKVDLPIQGIDLAERMNDVVVFHMGTPSDGDNRTRGGRVLGVSALGSTLQDALNRAYAAAELIHFEGKYIRKDIGSSSLK